MAARGEMDYLILASLWTGWCTLHSTAISITATAYLKRRLGSRYRMFRIVFNLFAIATLIPVLVYSRSIPSVLVFRWEGLFRIGQAAMILAALFLFLAGARHYDGLQFLGIRQIRDRETEPGLTSTGQLNTSGILQVVRHPWYLGAIIIIWARDMDIATVVTNSVLTTYLIIGTLLEERKLVREFGEDYHRYQEAVSMLVPVKWLMARTRE